MMKNAEKPSVQTPPSRWRVALVTLQLVTFVLLTLSATSPTLHDNFFHGGHVHAEKGGAEEEAPHEEEPSHPCSLCVWSEGGFSAVASTLFDPIPWIESAPVHGKFATARSVGGFGWKAHAIRGPPMLNR